MLNLFKINTKKPTNNHVYIEKQKDKYYYKDFPVSTREWNNSIYAFNKNTLYLIPKATKSCIELITSYINIYNSNLLHNIKKTKLAHKFKFKKLSCHKIFISNAGFKHTNDKVIINIYTYNREKFNYLYFFTKKYLNLNSKVLKKIGKKLYLIKYKGLNRLKKSNNYKYNLIKNLNKLGIISTSYINNYLINFYKKWVKKSLQKTKIYFYYKQLFYVNSSKFNYTYLYILKYYLEKIYNKKVEFNIINLKYNFLNSDILSESISLKITRNRRKIMTYLERLIRKIKVYKTNKNVYKLELFKYDLIKSIQDPIEILLSNKTTPISIKQVVLKDIKYKRLSGVRLEASGRLTKRYTASRSISKLKYKGNLRNIDSSYKGLSSVILKGNIRSNLQYSKLKSKTRIGSFGIKGWVSGY